MANIGSAFLGDFARHRLLSSSTPPPSPPPTSIPSAFSGTHSPRSPTSNWPAFEPVQSSMNPAAQHAPRVIEPTLALDLRLRWLEVILLGVRQDIRDKREKVNELRHGQTLIMAAEDIQRRLDVTVEGNEGLKRFMDHYDQHAHLLTPSFALSGALPDPPSYENMSPEELEAFLIEMEPDIRAADRDMQEIEALEKKGVTGAGKLADYEVLQLRLNSLLDAYQTEVEFAASLEKRIASLVERHATHVDALSELFVAWDDTITVAEHQASKLERERDERRRLGHESE